MAVVPVADNLRAVCGECGTTLAYEAVDVHVPDGRDTTRAYIVCSECGAHVGVPLPATKRTPQEARARREMYADWRR